MFNQIWKQLIIIFRCSAPEFRRGMGGMVTNSSFYWSFQLAFSESCFLDLSQKLAFLVQLVSFFPRHQHHIEINAFQFFSMPNPSKLSGCRWGLGSGFQRRYQTKTNFWQIDALLIGSIIQIQVQEILVFARWVHKKQDVKASKVFLSGHAGSLLRSYFTKVLVWYILMHISEIWNEYDKKTIKFNLNRSSMIWHFYHCLQYYPISEFWRMISSRK